MRKREREMEIARCAVMACRKEITPGETYYLLAGGKVMNCEDCACNSKYTIMVGKVEIEMVRGWDKTAVSKNLKKVM